MKHRRIVEYIIIVCLLMVFGFTGLSLLYAGVETYENINLRRNTQNDLRLAASYVNVKIRQYDAKGMLSIEENSLTGKRAMVIHEVFDGVPYDTWVYFDSGKLREATLEKGAELSNDFSFEIASLDSFDIAYKASRHQIVAKIGKKGSRGLEQLEVVVTLRASGGGGLHE